MYKKGMGEIKAQCHYYFGGMQVGKKSGGYLLSGLIYVIHTRVQHGASQVQESCKLKPPKKKFVFKAKTVLESGDWEQLREV